MQIPPIRLALDILLDRIPTREPIVHRQRELRLFEWNVGLEDSRVGRIGETIQPTQNRAA